MPFLSKGQRALSRARETVDIVKAELEYLRRKAKEKPGPTRFGPLVILKQKELSDAQNALKHAQRQAASETIAPLARRWKEKKQAAADISKRKDAAVGRLARKKAEIERKLFSALVAAAGKFPWDADRYDDLVSDKKTGYADVQPSTYKRRKGHILQVLRNTGVGDIVTRMYYKKSLEQFVDDEIGKCGLPYTDRDRISAYEKRVARGNYNKETAQGKLYEQRKKEREERRANDDDNLL